MLGVYFSCVLGEKSKIQLSWEHSEYRWVTIQEAEELLTKQNWLVKLMKRAAYIRPLLPDRLIEFNRRNGFDC
jgi:hypothetical protein